MNCGWVITFKLLNHEWDVFPMCYVHIHTMCPERKSVIDVIQSYPITSYNHIFFGFKLIINYDNLSMKWHVHKKNSLLHHKLCRFYLLCCIIFKKRWWLLLHDTLIRTKYKYMFFTKKEHNILISWKISNYE